jgi:DNA-binding protein WhiA
MPWFPTATSSTPNLASHFTAKDDFMSFGNDTKTALCGIYEKKACCRKALLYGLLFGSSKFSIDDIHIHTENENVANLMRAMLRKTAGVRAEITKQMRGQDFLFELTVDDPLSRQMVCNLFQQGADEDCSKNISKGIIKKRCCAGTFLRGVFLSSGTIINPKKSYHLEFTLQDADTAASLESFIEDQGFAAKKVVRKNNHVIYFKESENIEDVLSFMGATNAALEIMNIKIYKGLRNNANRITNCETANINKLVDASAEQIEAIRKIQRTKGLDFLPDQLKQVAEARIENPELSLKEIALKMDPVVSKSGVNHRLQKIIEIAKNING